MNYSEEKKFQLIRFCSIKFTKFQKFFDFLSQIFEFALIKFEKFLKNLKNFNILSKFLSCSLAYIFYSFLFAFKKFLIFIQPVFSSVFSFLSYSHFLSLLCILSFLCLPVLFVYLYTVPDIFPKTFNIAMKFRQTIIKINRKKEKYRKLGAISDN